MWDLSIPEYASSYPISTSETPLKSHLVNFGKTVKVQSLISRMVVSGNWMRLKNLTKSRII